ncbi:hypothetical protein HKX54_11265 [Sulfitobacter sp. M57]|uniref:COG4223 family protein n=1 Tax=unclassified Sulfitobacter TaxID=196795 RepID=UPI0023E09878|nr:MULTISPECIES: hypothetical protein [unclassified Sulfitobacter]MDF3433582.1 hypothetical protein [Sulfitobacter sp. KE42]MDF3459222.1 hypothetical protein [Sulfitobacter sp. S74]MDF3498073.1 hypothetical protein [Sulfitobacter sp. M56]MDF3509778.1 hypothetical protein [Sulfitobacter sp. M57]MDF3525375.1 hypothetical protein [Sulfitobacter sp. S66]
MAKAKKPTPSSKSTSGAAKDVGGKVSKPDTETSPETSKTTDPEKTPTTKTGATTKATTRKATASTIPAAKPAKSATAATTSSVPKTAKPDATKKPATPVEAQTDASAKAQGKPTAPEKVVEKPQVVKDDKPAATPSQNTEESKPAEQKTSVFWPLLFGGVIAGGLGFVAAEMDIFDSRGGDDEVAQTLNSQSQRIAKLENADAPDLQGVQDAITALSDGVSALEARLEELENRPASTGGDAASPEYAEDLAALQASVEAQQSEISRLLKNAQSVEEATANAARKAQAQRALTAITVALASGAGYETALQDLSASGVADIPAALQENSEGVAPLLGLQTGFPDTARAALSVARAAGGDEAETGIGGFLKRQLSARSVAPREGDDPDAVLSRAEAAVREGRVADALTEIETLPAPVQDAMADWLASARARAATEAAVQDLSQRLTAN